MKEEEILRGLEELMRHSGVQVRYEKGDFDGGLCIIKDKRMLILNRTQSSAYHIRVLAGELAKLPLDEVFMLPALRQVIDEVGLQPGR